MTTTNPLQTTDNELANEPGNWVNGTWNGLKVSAKVFAEPSEEYGLACERRISKLWVATPGSFADRIVLLDFDRGDFGKNYLKDEVRDEICAALVAHRNANPVG